MYQISPQASKLVKSWHEKLQEETLRKDPCNFPGDIFEPGVGWRKFTAEESEIHEAEAKYWKGEKLERQMDDLITFRPEMTDNNECETCGRRFGIR